VRLLFVFKTAFVLGTLAHSFFQVALQVSIFKRQGDVATILDLVCPKLIDARGQSGPSQQEVYGTSHKILMMVTGGIYHSTKCL